jgi:hypothetical protein
VELNLWLSGELGHGCGVLRSGHVINGGGIEEPLGSVELVEMLHHQDHLFICCSCAAALVSRLPSASLGDCMYACRAWCTLPGGSRSGGEVAAMFVAVLSMHSCVIHHL